MITPPGPTGVAFSEASDGDLRSTSADRYAASSLIGISFEWAWLDQVHGSDVVRASTPGLAGAGDGLWTTERLLPIAVFTADCYGVVLESPGAVGVAHVGWRGARSAVVTELREAMTESGYQPIRAHIGPGIGPCCFEVGEDVSSQFPNFVSETSWGSRSVDLRAAIRAELAGITVWGTSDCTYHTPGYFSHRRDKSPRRLATIGWLR